MEQLRVGDGVYHRGEGLGGGAESEVEDRGQDAHDDIPSRVVVAAANDVGSGGIRGGGRLAAITPLRFSPPLTRMIPQLNRRLPFDPFPSFLV